MTRRLRRASAQRLRDATREALRKDLRTYKPRRKTSDWRKPFVVHGNGNWSLWIDRACVLAAPAVYFMLHQRAAGLALLWGPLLARRFARRPALELSRTGARLLRTRPRRTIPWKDVRHFSDSAEALVFEELRDEGPSIRHTVPGVESSQRFRAAAIFRAQTAANVFD